MHLPPRASGLQARRCLQGTQLNMTLPWLCRVPWDLRHISPRESPKLFRIHSHKPSSSSAFLPKTQERDHGFFQAQSSNFIPSQMSHIPLLQQNMMGLAYPHLSQPQGAHHPLHIPKRGGFFPFPA